ncbi:MAG: hypothetical protein ACI8S6_004500, partial [Myxococcota bacterium]
MAPVDPRSPPIYGITAASSNKIHVTALQQP